MDGDSRIEIQNAALGRRHAPGGGVDRGVLAENKKPAKPITMRVSRDILAEAVRFELTDGCPSPVFKTGALNRSATLP
jgi:hypothetical protein